MDTMRESGRDREAADKREKHEDLARWGRYGRAGESVPNEEVRLWLAKVAAGSAAPWSR